MPRGRPRFNDAPLEAMGLLAAHVAGFDGSGIAIGFVDYGFDLLHPALRHADRRRSRFSRVWCQGSPAGVLERSAIERLIRRAQDRNDRRWLDEVYDPHQRYYGRYGVIGGAHGTSMASIAAGTATASFRGAAPGAEIIGVHLDLPDHAWKEQSPDGEPAWAAMPVDEAAPWSGWKDYDSAQAIVDGLDFLYQSAARSGVAGLVVNVSVGTWAGAHDGNSPVERKIAELIETGRTGAGPAVAVVVGAGNAGADAGHFAGRVTSATPARFQWLMSAADPTQNKLEIWYDGAAPRQVALTTPAPIGGAPHTIRLELGRTTKVMLGDRLIGIADHQPRVRDRLCRARILLHPPFFPDALPVGEDGWMAFGIEIGAARAGASAAPSEIHAWIERDDGLMECSMLRPSTRTGTLCSFATAPGAFVVAGYDHARSRPEKPAPFPPSSLGPPPWSANAAAAVPLLCAPAHRIFGAASKSDGYLATSGTSAAAALTSGLVAVLMQRALAERGRICIGEIEDELIAAASTRGRRAGRWQADIGYGRARIAHLTEDAVHDGARAL